MPEDLKFGAFVMERATRRKFWFSVFCIIWHVK